MKITRKFIFFISLCVPVYCYSINLEIIKSDNNLFENGVSIISIESQLYLVSVASSIKSNTELSVRESQIRAKAFAQNSLNVFVNGSEIIERSEFTDLIVYENIDGEITIVDKQSDYSETIALLSKGGLSEINLAGCWTEESITFCAIYIEVK